ncbi:uncharacterized protein [Aegilops tauschii subsp. strangulata]|uniref:uncharacterized protein n=1 Tax=Aegilops tauschii subsp. strangulata TaxID=200361 RepID=UPI003CC8C3AF
MPQFQGDRIGDPYAAKKKKKFKPVGASGSKLSPSLPAGSSKGTAAEPIPEGHVSANCPSRAKPLLLQTMGHAIPSGGFFCLQFPADLQSGFVVNAAILSAAPGLLSKKILEVELPHLFEGAWDWQVTQIEADRFSVVFPDPAMLRMATRSGKLFLSINNITMLIRDVVADAPKGETMPEVWIKLWGIPPKHRGVDRLMARMTMLGRPLVVDEHSLIRSGPVRMLFACRKPEKMRGSVQIWFNGEGFLIKLEPELDPPRRSAPAPAPSPTSVFQGQGTGPW